MWYLNVSISVLTYYFLFLDLGWQGEDFCDYWDSTNAMIKTTHNIVLAWQGSN